MSAHDSCLLQTNSLLAFVMLGRLTSAYVCTQLCSETETLCATYSTLCPKVYETVRLILPVGGNMAPCCDTDLPRILAYLQPCLDTYCGTLCYSYCMQVTQSLVDHLNSNLKSAIDKADDAEAEAVAVQQQVWEMSSDDSWQQLNCMPLQQSLHLVWHAKHPPCVACQTPCMTASKGGPKAPGGTNGGHIEVEFARSAECTGGVCCHKHCRNIMQKLAATLTLAS